MPRGLNHYLIVFDSLEESAEVLKYLKKSRAVEISIGVWIAPCQTDLNSFYRELSSVAVGSVGIFVAPVLLDQAPLGIRGLDSLKENLKSIGAHFPDQF